MGDRRKRHCKQGHELTPSNSRFNSEGCRECLACSRSRRLKAAREKAEAAKWLKAIYTVGEHRRQPDA